MNTLISKRRNIQFALLLLKYWLTLSCANILNVEGAENFSSKIRHHQKPFEYLITFFFNVKLSSFAPTFYLFMSSPPCIKFRRDIRGET